MLANHSRLPLTAANGRLILKSLAYFLRNVRASSGITYILARRNGLPWAGARTNPSAGVVSAPLTSASVSRQASREF